MEIFDTNFVASVKTEIQRRLDAGEPTSRKVVLQALGITSKGAEVAISALFALGLLEEYKILKKAGIKPKDYVSPSRTVATGARRAKKAAKDNDSDVVAA